MSAPHRRKWYDKETTAAPYMRDCAFICCHIAQDPVVDLYTFYIASPEDGTCVGSNMQSAESEFYM
jgi:hypothetical protein